MTTGCRDTIPQERLRVFISSAQNTEDGFDWETIRRSIKACLAECPYLNPFIIEDSPSQLPSTQLFQYQVKQSDIVVLLVKGDVRKGTAMECAVAMQAKKPMLVYFLESDTTQESVKRLKDQIQNTDYCTYMPVKDLRDLDLQIRNKVMEDVIRFFQYRHFADNCGDTCSTELSITIETDLSNASVPTKTALGLFSSSYIWLFRLLRLPYSEEVKEDTSALHSFGTAALEWLVTGKDFCTKDGTKALLDACTELYDNMTWLEKRWDAIRLALVGQYDLALKAEKEALAIARDGRVPHWIVDDILIDCRNLEIHVHEQNNEITFKNEAQKEIDKLNTTIHLPVLDRYHANIFDTISKEELRVQTASPNAILMGSSLGSAVNDVINYFFCAIIYGSYTHIRVSRELLANVLYKYALLFEDSHLLVSALKILTVSGDADKFKKLLDHNWEDVYSDVTSSPDIFWTLTGNAPLTAQDSIRQAVATKLGLYFSDPVFHEVECYLESFAPHVYWGVSEAFFDCLYRNIARLSAEMVTQVLVDIIKTQRFHIGTTVALTILSLHLDDVSEDTQQALCNALTEKLPFIVKNGGTPQIVAALSKQNPKIFSGLATLPGNGLQGIEKIYYDINMGCDSWAEVLIREIDTAEKEFEANNTSGIYTSHRDMPYATIKDVIRNHYDNSMEPIISKKLFPLCTKLLSSHVAAKMKSDCIDCLCDVLIAAPEHIGIPETLKQCISKLDAANENYIFERTSDIVAQRILVLKVLVGIVGAEALSDWSFGFSRKETREKIVIAQCIEQFIRNCIATSQDINMAVVSIVMQCCSDKYYGVRQCACGSLVLLLQTKYHDLAEAKLYQAAIDPVHYVRNQVLRLCRNGSIADQAINDKIIQTLKKDANYALRHSCDDV